MIRRVGLRVALMSALGCAALAAQAHAATDLGQLGTNHSCGGNDYTEIQTATGGAPRYDAPMDGVINSWSVEMTNSPGVVVQLKIFRPTAAPDQFKLIGESSRQAATPNVVNTFPTSIPVKTGDLLGIYVVDGLGYDCLFDTTNSGDVAKEVNPDHSVVGDTVTTASVFNPTRVNVAATEVPPSTPATGQRAAALKKCKKRAKKHHWSKKRLKKCKKKARLLPV